MKEAKKDVIRMIYEDPTIHTDPIPHCGYESRWNTRKTTDIGKDAFRKKLRSGN